MINNYANKLWFPISSGSPFGRKFMMFFGVLVLMLFSSLEVVGQLPNYTHDAVNSKDLDDFTVTIADAFNVQAKLNRLIIAVDTHPNGEQYVLTFGNGVKKVGTNGSLIDFIPNQSDRLSNAMDFAINSDGKFFVATNESNRRFIRVYSPTGAYLSSETLGDGSYGSQANNFKGPTGLAFDNDDNLYVADHYIGDANPSKPSSIKIYRKDAAGIYKNNLINQFDNIGGTLLNFPFRLAVNSQKQLYVSELGQDDKASVKILQLDSDFKPTKIGEIGGVSSQIGAPGSIIIDKFDYIFIADFGNEIDLPKLLGATDDPNQFYKVFDIIKKGIQNNVFNINIYNPDNTYRSKVSTGIDFAVDLAISLCGTMYVNNTIFDGSFTPPVCFFGVCTPPIPDISVDFDLEVYNRSQGYDTEKPTIVSCPGDQNENLTNGSLILPDYRSLASFTDNCDKDLTLVQSPAVGAIITETTEVTITAKDDSGNVAVCTFNVIIDEPTDTEDPMISCPPAITQNNDSGKCGAMVTFANATATDNSGVAPTITRIDNTGLNSGNLFPVGPTTITFRATDGAGNTSDCSFIITVSDNEEPSISCPQNITETAPFGETGKVITYSTPSFEDNCSGATITQTAGQASGTKFPIGKTTNTFEVIDASGNTAACSFDVTITEDTDTEAPVISCPPAITQNNDVGKCGAIVTFANATATDNSGVAPTITRVDNTGLNSGDLFPFGPTTITFRATDAAGNTSECSIIITVTDNENPTISCPQNITETAPFGETGKVITYSTPSFADNCSGSTITQTAGQASGTKFPIGKTTNTFEVTDASGNSATCSFDVTITENSDTEVPVISCPPAITQNTDPEKCGAMVTFADATATDNSGNVTVTLISSLNSGSEFPIGNSTVTFKAEDEAGNTSECSFIITVTDNEEPSISCPQNITETAPFGETGKVITYSTPSFSDNCSGSTITQTVGQASGTKFPIGKTTNTFEVTDASGNTATCSFDVTISVNTDTEKPVINCPDNINQNTDSGKCGAIVTFGDATATDNSGGATVKLISNLPSGSEFPVGKSTVTFEAEDGAGNTSECSFIITVSDNEEPSISCPPNITETVPFEETGKVITYSTPSFEDNCSGFTITQTAGQASGTKFPIGKTTNTFKVTDASGNSVTCSFDVTITENSDTEKPVISCPTSITQNVDTGKCGAEVTFANATATDDSGNVTVTLVSDLPSGSEFPVGLSTVTFEARDNAGNTSTCSFEIRIVDNIAPSVNCPQEVIVEYTTDKSYTVPDFSTLYSNSDNCSTTLNYFQTPDIGAVVTEDMSASFRVGDQNNNFITCNFKIKFFKNTELQITNCPAEQTFEVDSNCSYLIPDIASTITTNLEGAVVTQNIEPGFSVNNSLRLTITAKFEDQTDICEVELLAIDSIDPVVICPGDQNETFNPENGFSLPNYTLQAQASDNCAVAKIEQFPDVGTVIFENTDVTVRIDDIFGNSATCTFNVILAEENTVNTPPIANNDSYSTLQDETLTVPASSGVLSNDFDGEGDGLSAILISSVSSGTLSLNSDGSFIYEPIAGLFGTDSFTYVSNDGSENSKIATVRIDVVAVSGNSVTCKEAITLELNENGTASLSAETLFVTRPADLQFSVNQEIFTCDDLGENVVTLNYSNSAVQGSCEVLITIKDATPPQVSIKDITVALNEFRFVRITPEMLDNGSSDNCEITMLSLDKESFGCKELGENVVTFTATDSSGNTTSATAIVTVTGNCELQPFPDVEYIFIYPNPTSGPFQFATPAGVTIQRVEAYDARGRMIMFKNFSEIDLQYAMDLFGVQQAVYILKLFTSEGLNIIRVIIN